MKKLIVLFLIFLILPKNVFSDENIERQIENASDDELIKAREKIENELMSLENYEQNKLAFEDALDYLECRIINYPDESPCGEQPACVADEDIWKSSIRYWHDNKDQLENLHEIVDSTIKSVAAVGPAVSPPTHPFQWLFFWVKKFWNWLTGHHCPISIVNIIGEGTKLMADDFFKNINNFMIEDILRHGIERDCLENALKGAAAENVKPELETLLQQIIDEMNRRGLIYKNPNVDYNINDPGNVTHSTSSRYPHPDETFANPCSSCPGKIDYNPRCWADKKPLVLLQNGHSYSMMHLLWEYDPDLRLVPPRGLPIDPEKYPVLIIPSGGFMGLDSSDIFKECIRDYVENGGTLIVFSQQHGYEYKALPMGEEIEAYGWREDQACHTHAAAISTYKQCFCSQEEGMLDIDIDGFFYEWPENAEVLLERNRNGMPAIIFYEYGKGKIIATTLYQGFSFAQGSLTEDSKRLLGDILDYAYYGDVDEYAPGELTIPVEIENNSDATVKKVILDVIDPEYKTAQHIKEEIDLAPYDTTLIELPIEANSIGFWKVDCTLYDENWSRIEKLYGKKIFVVSKYKGNPDGFKFESDIGFDVISSSNEYLYGSPVDFNIIVRNHSDRERTIRVRYCLPRHRKGVDVHRAAHRVFWSVIVHVTTYYYQLSKTLVIPPHGEGSFTYTLDRLTTTDALWARFYENSEYLGKVSKGVKPIMGNDALSIKLKGLKNEYQRNENVEMEIQYKNTKDVTLELQTAVEIVDQEKNVLFTKDINLELSPHEERIEKISYYLDKTISPGVYSVRTKTVLLNAERSRNIIKGSKFKILSPEIKTELSINEIDAVNKSPISIKIKNIGEGDAFGINLNITLLDPDGRTDSSHEETFDLKHGEEKTLYLPLNLTDIYFGEYTLRYEIEYDNDTLKGEIPLENKLEITSKIEKNKYRIRENAKINVNLNNVGVFKQNFECRILFNEEILDTRYTVIPSKENRTIEFEWMIPEDLPPGEYEITIRAGQWNPRSKKVFFTIPESKIEGDIYIDKNMYVSGDAIGYSFINTGGVDTQISYCTKLYDIYGKIVNEITDADTIKAGETKLYSIEVPENIVKGKYFLTAECENERTMESITLFDMLEIEGLEANLNIDTDQKVYFEDEIVKILANIAGNNLENARLNLKIFTYGIPDKFWHSFRKNERNTGFTSLKGNINNPTIKWETKIADTIVSYPVIGDLNGDGKGEIVIVGDSLKVFDGNGNLLFDSINTPYNINGPCFPALSDLNNDGILDIVVPSFEDRCLYAFSDFSLLWMTSFSDSEYVFISPPVVADLNSDGKNEVIVSAGLEFYITFLLDGETGEIIWSFPKMENSNKQDFRKKGIISGASIPLVPGVADINNDGEKEIVMSGWYIDQSHEPTPALIVLGSNGNLLWKYDALVVSSPIIEDINGDGSLEICFIADGIYCLEEDGTLLWRILQDFSGTNLAVADINSDGKKEIVAFLYRDYGSYKEGYVYTVDSEGNILWHIDELGDVVVMSPCIADIDNDNDLELILMDLDNAIYSLDGKTRTPEWWLEYSGIAPAIGDIDGDNFAEIVIGTKDGKLVAIDSQNPSIGNYGDQILVWKKDIILDTPNSLEISTQSFKSGRYIIEGTLYTESNQIIDRDTESFLVTEKDVYLTLDTDKNEYKSGEDITIYGEAFNDSDKSIDTEIIVKADGEIVYTESLTLRPEESHIFEFEIHKEKSFTLSGEIEDYLIKTYVAVKKPKLHAEIIAPDFVGRSFEANLILENTGDVDIDITVNFGEIIDLELPKEQKTVIPKTFETNEDMVLIATITDDITQTITKHVVFGEDVIVNIPQTEFIEGLVEIPIILDNIGEVDSLMKAIYYINDLIIEREYFIPKNESVEDSICLELDAGEYSFLYETPFESDIVSIYVQKKYDINMDFDISVDDILNMDVLVWNNGSCAFDGILVLETEFYYEEVSIHIEGESSQAIPFSISPICSPGTYDITTMIKSNDEVLVEKIKEFNISSEFSVSVLTDLNFNPEETRIIEFEITNESIIPNGAEFHLIIPGLSDQRELLFFNPKESKIIEFEIEIPGDLEEGEYRMEYEIDGKKEEIPFYVNGLNINVNAFLDKNVYEIGETAILQVDVENLSYEMGFVAKVQYGDFEEIKDFVNSSTVYFEIPVTNEKQLFYGIYTASGRSLYLNSKYINLKNDKIAVYTDKKSYLPGETVTVFVETDTEGILYIEAPEYINDFDIDGNMNFSFIASDLPSNNYPMGYIFKYGNEEVKGVCNFDIEGLDVKIREFELEKDRYEPSDTLKINSCIYSNRSFNAKFSFELYDSSNELIKKIECEKFLEEGDNKLSFEIPFSTTTSGVHKILYKIEKFYGVEYFDVQGPVIYSIFPNKSFYYQEEEKHVTVIIKGEGLLRIYLDGTEIYENYSDSDELIIPLYVSSEGFHTIKAEIISGTSNKKEAGFFVFGEFSLESSETTVINPLAYKSLAESTLSKVNEEMEVVKALIEVKKENIDLDEIEKTLEEIETYIDRGKEMMDSGNYIVANNLFNTALKELLELEDYLLNK